MFLIFEHYLGGIQSHKYDPWEIDDEIRTPNKVYKFNGRLSILHEDVETGKRLLLDAKKTGQHTEILITFDPQIWRELNT